MLKYYKNIFMSLLKSNFGPNTEAGNTKKEILSKISKDKGVADWLKEIEKAIAEMKIEGMNAKEKTEFLKKYLWENIDEIDEKQSWIADKIIIEIVNASITNNTNIENTKVEVKGRLWKLKDTLTDIKEKTELSTLTEAYENKVKTPITEISIVAPWDKLSTKKEEEASIVNNEFSTPLEFFNKVKENIDINVKLTKILSQLEKEINNYKVEDYPRFIEGLQLIIKNPRESKKNDMSKLMVIKSEIPADRANRLIEILNNKIKDKESIAVKTVTELIQPVAETIQTPKENLDTLINSIKKSKLFSKLQINDINKKTKEELKITNDKGASEINTVRSYNTEIPQLRDNKKTKPNIENVVDNSIDSTKEVSRIIPFDKNIWKILEKSNINLNNFTNDDAIAILDRYKATPYSKDFWKKDEAYPLTVAIQQALWVEPIDGKFWPKTKKAVIDFQKENGLKGKRNWAAGPITIKAILDNLNTPDS